MKQVGWLAHTLVNKLCKPQGILRQKTMKIRTSCEYDIPKSVREGKAGRELPAAARCQKNASALRVEEHACT
jgi:hypothetical protein